MRLHPQGANWRNYLEVMLEQSVRHGALHPECPDIRKSVHCAAVRGLEGNHGFPSAAGKPANHGFAPSSRSVQSLL
jgi:hypothetical protein